MKKSTFTILICLGVAGIISGIYSLAFNHGYGKGYEAAIDRALEIFRGTKEFPYSTVQKGLDAADSGSAIIPDSFEIYDNDTWMWVRPPDDGDTFVFVQPFKYLKLKIVGMDKAKIHGYFPDSDSTWSHYVIE